MSDYMFAYMQGWISKFVLIYVKFDVYALHLTPLIPFHNCRKSTGDTQHYLPTDIKFYELLTPNVDINDYLDKCEPVGDVLDTNSFTFEL